MVGKGEKCKAYKKRARGACNEKLKQGSAEKMLTLVRNRTKIRKVGLWRTLNKAETALYGGMK